MRVRADPQSACRARSVSAWGSPSPGQKQAHQLLRNKASCHQQECPRDDRVGLDIQPRGGDGAADPTVRGEDLSHHRQFPPAAHDDLQCGEEIRADGGQRHMEQDLPAGKAVEPRHLQKLRVYTPHAMAQVDHHRWNGGCRHNEAARRVILEKCSEMG